MYGIMMVSPMRVYGTMRGSVMKVYGMMEWREGHRGVWHHEGEV